MLATFLPGIQRELLDLRAADRGVQIVVQTAAIRQVEEARCQTLQLASAQGFRTTRQFVTAVEQPVDVLVDKTLAVTHGVGVAEQEQNACAWFQLTTGDFM